MFTEPITHRQLLSQLSVEQKRALTERSNVAGLMQMMLHLGSIGILIGLVLVMPIGYIFLLPLGIAWVFLFTAFHECMHRTPFQSDWISNWFARFISVILFLPAEWFRFFHFAHHRHTHQPGRDPELDMELPKSMGQYLFYLSGLSVWGSHLKTLFRNSFMAVDELYIPNAALPMIRREARWMLLLYAVLMTVSIIFHSTLLLQIWIIPIVLGQPFLRMYLLAEHRRCPHVSDMLDNTRTTYANKLVRLLAWNMPFHAEHHIYPSVPFHKLPEFNKLTAPYLKQTSSGYGDFHQKLVRENYLNPGAI